MSSSNAPYFYNLWSTLHPGLCYTRVIVLLWNWQSLWVIFDVKASAILLTALLKQTLMTILFRGHLNKVKGSARMDRGHKDTYCLGPWEQTIRKTHHLGFVRIYDVLYLDHQLSHRVINCYCSYNVCRNLTTTIKIGHKFRHQYQWQALTWGHRPKQKTKFSLQEYKKSTGIRISKVIQCHWMVTIFW